MEKQPGGNVETAKKRKILSGINLAWAYVIMSLLGGLGMRQDGEFGQADDAFVGGTVALIGIFLYQIRKKHNYERYFPGSKILEGTLAGILVIFLFISFTNPLGNWYQSPLAWAVVPIWALVAYLILRFKKQKTKNT